MQRQFVGSLLAGLAVMVALPGTAFAQAQAYTAAPTVLRAGPGTDYPEVTQLPGGIPVTVMGCVSGYSWCDVAMPDLRGWVYAGRLVYPYEGQNVPLLNYGAVIGFPIIGFSVGSYWGNYYRGRPWYNDRNRWEGRPGPGWHGGPGPEFRGGGPGPRPEYHGPGPGFQGGPRPGEGFHGGGRPEGPRPEFNGGRPGGGGPQPGGHEGGGGPRPGGGHEGGGPPQGGGGHGGPQGGGGGGGHGGGGGGGGGGGDHGPHGG